MDQTTKSKILDQLTKAQNIIITFSQNSNFDGLASALALYLSLTKLGKNVSVVGRVVSVGDARQLYAVDKIGQVPISKNLMVVIENAIATVDKVTYFLDGNKLKVIIHALPATSGIIKNQVTIEEVIGQADLLIAIGFDSQENLRSEITLEQIINSNSFIININKGGVYQKFAQVNVLYNEAVTVSEVTAKMLEDLALPVDEDIAFNLYTGISETTAHFQPSKVSPFGLQIAAWLLKFGASKASLAQKSTVQISPQPTPFATQDRTPTLQEVETKEEKPPIPSADWLSPPKIYKGSKSFDKEN